MGYLPPIRNRSYQQYQQRVIEKNKHNKLKFNKIYKAELQRIKREREENNADEQGKGQSINEEI